MRKQENEYLKAVSEARQTNTNFSEQKITYISGGTLALSITYVEKFSITLSLFEYTILSIAWFLLASTLLVNLFSCLLTAYYAKKTEDEIYKQLPYKKQDKNITSRNRRVWFVNWTGYTSLVIGVALMILFVCTNIYSRKKSEIKMESKIESLHKVDK